MTFGDIPAAELQARFEEEALHEFEASSPMTKNAITHLLP